jgi:hypothetical protein
MRRAVRTATPTSWNGNSGIPPPLELAELVEVLVGELVAVEVDEVDVEVVLVVAALTTMVPFIQVW